MGDGMRDHSGTAGIVDQDVEPALGGADRGGEAFDCTRILRRRAAGSVTRGPSLCVKRFSLKKLNRDAAADRTLCRDAYRTARAQNVRPCSFWSFAALLDQWLRPAIFALESS
jgi:hypothetical protein